MGMASGSGGATSCGFDSDSPAESFAKTFSFGASFAGKGITLFTSCARMAPLLTSPPPQLSPGWERIAPAVIAPAKSMTCRTAERLTEPRQCSSYPNIFGVACMRLRYLLLRRSILQWLRHDADVGDTRLLDRVHHRREGAERNILVGAQVDLHARRVAQLFPRLRAKLIDVDGIIAQVK